MLKFLYFLIAKENHSKFNEIYLNEKNKHLFEDMIGEKNKKEIIESKK